MTQKRRRLDMVLEDEFVADLAAESLDDLREKRQLVDELENELSYYRRLLHGRLDVLGFELARRRGEETRSIIEALPDLLAGGLSSTTGSANPLGRLHGDFVPSFPEVERRFARITDDDFITRLSEFSDEELEGIRADLTGIESDLSGTRSRLHEVYDTIVAEIASRYQAADSA